MFTEVKTVKFLKLISSLTEGYSTSFLNFDDNTANNDLLKRLNEIQMKQEKRKLQDLDISERESKCIDEFYDRELGEANSS